MSLTPHPVDLAAEGTSDASAGQIVVCIPTCRRPEKLRQLLRALKELSPAPPFSIVVGNNDTTGQFQLSPDCDDLPDFMLINVAEPGVSEVRNSLIDFALRSFTHLRWIAFLDDDQVPAPNWLQELSAAANRYSPALAGGPVLRIPEQQTRWSQAATRKNFLPSTTGFVPMLNEAGNLLLSVDFIKTLSRKPFSLQFGRSGGEDYEFFCFAASRGTSMLWVQTAVVYETFPLERCLLPGLLMRSFASSAAQARADRRYDTAGDIVLKTLKRAARVPAHPWRVLRSGGGIGVACGTMFACAAGFLGWVTGLAGLQLRRYG